MIETQSKATLAHWAVDYSAIREIEKDMLSPVKAWNRRMSSIFHLMGRYAECNNGGVPIKYQGNPVSGTCAWSHAGMAQYLPKAGCSLEIPAHVTEVLSCGGRVRGDTADEYNRGMTNMSAQRIYRMSEQVRWRHSVRE